MLKSGLSKKDYKLLKKTKSDLTKQIGDSKVQNKEFTKSNHFFKNLQEQIHKDKK